MPTERPDLAALRRRYTPEPVPPCPVCGAALETQSGGGGRPEVWACPRYRDRCDGPRPFDTRREHYRASRVEVHPGDPEVLALADYAEGLERLLEARDAD